MPTVGQQVSYNEGAEGADSWVPAWVLMTHDSWSPDAAAAMGAGNYPRQPAADEVMLAYWSIAGSTLASPVSGYAAPGTGFGQFS